MAGNAPPVISFLEIDGKVLSGEEFEEYCKDHGICKRCAKVKTHRRALKLFGKGSKWDPLTVHDEDTGDYTVYKGYCMQSTCYTIGQAKRLLGETGSRNNNRRAGRRSGSEQRSSSSRTSKGMEKRRSSTTRRSKSSSDGSTAADDDASVGSNMSGMSGMSGMSALSAMSSASTRSMRSFIGNLTGGKARRAKRMSSNASCASSVSSSRSIDFSDDDTIASTASHAHTHTQHTMPTHVEDGQISPIVQHRIEQLILYSYFTVLDLSKVELGEVDVDAIVDGLKKAKTLESVVLDKCKLNDGGVEKLAAALIEGNHLTIKKISLRQNTIGNRGATAMAQVCQRSTTLEEFDLSDNSISSRGAAAVIGAFHKNPNPAIHTLNLAQNEIWDMDDGTFLKTNKTLKVLNLDGNFMHDEGAEQIANAIAGNKRTKMEKLYLGWNGIADEGAQALAKMMEVNSTIQVLGLAENDISNTGARAMLSALAVNTSVREISGLYHNQIDRKFIIVAIKRLLHRYGERGEAEGALPAAVKHLVVQQESKLPAGEEEKTHEGNDDDSDDNSENSLNWASQLYSNEQEPEEEKLAVQASDSVTRTSVALEAIENWDWGTFGIEEIEAQSETNRMPDMDLEPVVAVDNDAPHHSPPHSSANFPVDRLTVFQSAPLAYFNRLTTEHHAVPLLDFDYEARCLTEALGDDSGLEAKIELEFENATTDRFSVFFSQGASRVMHFSCHGHELCLALENGFGYMQAVPVEDLKRFVAIGGGKVQVVVISAYHAQTIAKTFLEAGVPHVVCCQQEGLFRDEGSIEFAKGFYRALAQSKPLKEAFDIGVDAVARSPKVKSSRNMADRYLLLPEKKDHDVPVFFQTPLKRKTPISIADTSMLPPIPEHFVGREVDMYEILESLRVDDVVRIGGAPGNGKASLVAAVSRYLLKRPKSFLISNVFWLPHLKYVAPDEDSLYGDLCQVVSMLVDAEDDLWEEEEYKDLRERILIEMEGKRIIFVIDGRLFNTEASGENLERFLSHLLNETSVKIILLTASEVSASSKTSRSHMEETIVHVAPLDFKSSAILFGNASKIVSGRGCPAAHTAEEFAAFLVPPSIAKLADQSKNSSRRQNELYERMGNGNPAKIIETASNMSEDEFNDLLRFAQRPDVKVDSAGALETEIIKRAADKDKAIKTKNYGRAQDLTATLDELESLRKKFPSLSDLLSQERKMKRELAGILAQRKYDDANALKRKILALKKIINKEKEAQPSDVIGKYSATGKLAELQAQMDNMLKMASSMGKSLSALDASMTLADDADHATLAIVNEDKTCTLEIYCGDAADFDYTDGTCGLVCWTNENCDISDYEMGKKVMNLGGHKLEEDLDELSSIANTTWGPVKCRTGGAIMMGPRTYGKLVPRIFILAVSPLNPTNDDDDWDGDTNRDEDALHYLENALRSSYRSTFRMINTGSPEAVAIPIITTKETGGTYETTLRIGLQTLVQESKFSGLQRINLVASSKKEATTLIKMALAMGLKVK
jgi:hypothetical protein